MAGIDAHKKLGNFVENLANSSLLAAIFALFSISLYTSLLNHN